MKAPMFNARKPLHEDPSFQKRRFSTWRLAPPYTEASIAGHVGTVAKIPNKWKLEVAYKVGMCNRF